MATSGSTGSKYITVSIRCHTDFQARSCMLLVVQVSKRLPQQVRSSLGANARGMDKKIAEFVEQHSTMLQWLKQSSPPSTTSGTLVAATPARAQVRPAFTGSDGPMLTTRVWVPASTMTIADLEAGEVLLGRILRSARALPDRG